MDDENVSKYLIDSETGELIDTIYNGDKLKKVTKKQLDYLNETTLINENKSWNKAINSSVILLATSKLTTTECQILFVLMAHIGWNKYSQYAIKFKNRCFFRFLNSNDIKEIIKCSDSSFNRGIKSLEEKEIIKIEKNGKENIYIINPFLMYNGTRIPKEIYKKFEKSKFNLSK